MLVKIIQGEAVPQKPLLVTPQELVARESSARFIRKDEDLESALTHMTDHIAEPIVFDDILAQQTLGARALEMRFKDRFGVPPMRYLRDLRLERVKHLLESTDIKVIEIGRRCGMPNANHLCALFKKRYHKTPLQYRKSC